MFKNLKLKIKNSPKGISLPMATGLVTLLMVASVAVNELIIRTIRSVRSVEASNRAYFAAEAGIEDGLYELTPHYPGYSTPTLDNTDYNSASAARNGRFDTAGRWNNKWAIEGKSAAVGDWSKKIYKNQKLVISLFDDQTNNTISTANAIDGNAINPGQIVNLAPGTFSITFSLPETTKALLSGLLSGNKDLRVDNDQDGLLDEDTGIGVDFTELCPITSNKNNNPKDNDCDGKVNEDGNESPVIIWKLFDNAGKTLLPLKGCIGAGGSEFCENTFAAPSLAATLTQNDRGVNQDGVTMPISDFISAYPARLQFEFLLVIPMQAVNPSDPTQSFEIPYFDYRMLSNGTNIPFPTFTLKSDGYYGTYKQSITTEVTPKTTVPLFDFTIIQQQ